MNERIKELAGYVEKYISTTNFEGMPEDEMTYDEIFQKKFAELIVRECSDLLELEYAHSVLTGNKAAELVKKHFGVEVK